MSCLNCGMNGQFARVCTNPKVCANCHRKNHRTNECRAKTMSGIISATISRFNELKSPLPRILVKICNYRSFAVPDTGAHVTVAGLHFLKKFGLKECQLNNLPNF